MYSIKILDDYEYEIFNVFFIKLNLNMKYDYLLKVILFKEFLKGKELIYVMKEDCKNFVDYI